MGRRVRYTSDRNTRQAKRDKHKGASIATVALAPHRFSLTLQMNGAASRPVFSERLGRLHRDPVILAAFLGIIIVLFGLTSLFVDRYQHKESAIAADWFQRGETALQSSQADQAVNDFQNALAYAPNNDAYRLRLAQALIAAHRLQEARAHLLSLQQVEPGDGFVNLELARLAANTDQISTAQRYYHAAIYGVWPENPVRHRIDVRFELCQFLLDHQQTARAEAELLGLQAVLPKDHPEWHLRLAELLTRAGDDRTALEQYRQVLAEQPHNHEALVRAGDAAFRLQEYGQAEEFFRRAVAEEPQDRHAVELLETTTLVRELDPFLRGLPAKERADRTLLDFNIAMRRTQECALMPSPPPGVIQSLARGNQIQLRLRKRNMWRDPDLLDTTMSWVFQSEAAGQQECGPMSNQDRALLLLAGIYPAGTS
jgi:tetratricopeptide (TPR) repeat protein